MNCLYARRNDAGLVSRSQGAAKRWCNPKKARAGGEEHVLNLVGAIARSIFLSAHGQRRRSALRKRRAARDPQAGEKR